MSAVDPDGAEDESYEADDLVEMEIAAIHQGRPMRRVVRGRIVQHSFGRGCRMVVASSIDTMPMGTGGNVIWGAGGALYDSHPWALPIMF